LPKQVAQSWECHNSGWRIERVDEASLQKWLQGDVAYLFDPAKSITPQARSDIARLALLDRYGGVWADSTMLCLEPIDSWMSTHVLKAGLWMYHGNGGRMTPGIPSARVGH
jgi:mannosyltransferase OCH1-like enzyme